MNKKRKITFEIPNISDMWMVAIVTFAITLLGLWQNDGYMMIFGIVFYLISREVVGGKYD